MVTSEEPAVTGFVTRHTWPSQHGHGRGGRHILVAAYGGVATAFLTDLAAVLSVKMLLSGVRVASGVAVTTWSLSRWADRSRLGGRGVTPFVQGMRSWCLERGGGGHSDVKAPTGRLYSWSVRTMLVVNMLPSPCSMFVSYFGVVFERTTPEPPSAENATAIEVAMMSRPAWPPRHHHDALKRRNLVATAWAAATMSRQCWASRHGRDGLMRCDYSIDSASSLVLSYTSRSPGARNLRACETSQQRQGARQAEEMGQ
ncbi:hypothetical protein Taro_033637 [Colocasia esculenta]|uniref:Uncharacterized protein n=1 Tax=Colocasia esculenta TaxID=4460 RepID=A0A843VP94_COLES|nr:hypothetical protein [Colocasia esculenta]